MDENAPPGYLSPLGLLAGVRAMLLPGSGKDQPTPESESPNRPVLKDMNSSDGPKPRNLLSVAQGAEGTGPSSPASLNGDSPSVSSPGQGERRSVASDISFVSAVSAISRSDRLDSDNDASSDSCFETSYVSAAETSGNVSFLGDQFSKLVLNSPAPQSNLLNGGFEKPPAKLCNPWAGETLSADGTFTLDEDSTCDLTEDTLGSVCPENGNLIPTAQTSSSSIQSYFDATLEEAQGNDIINKTQILNEAPSNLETTDEIVSRSSEAVSTNLNSDLDSTIEGDCETNAALTQTAVEGGLNSTFTGIPDTTRNINVTFDGVSGSADLNLSVNQTLNDDSNNLDQNLSETVCTEDFNNSDRNLSANETVCTEDFNNSEWRHLISQTPLQTPQEVPCQVADLQGANLSITETPIANPSGSTDGLSISEGCGPEKKTQAQSEKYQPEEKATIRTHCDTVSENQGLGTSKGCELEKETQALSEEYQPEEETTPTHCDIVSECQDLSQESNHAQADLVAEEQLVSSTDVENSKNDSTSFDEAPLPVTKVETFEEILADGLAAEEQVPASHVADVEATPDPNCFDEAPLPVRKQRTFEEILAEELAASGEIVKDDLVQSNTEEVSVHPVAEDTEEVISEESTSEGQPTLLNKVPVEPADEAGHKLSSELEEKDIPAEEEERAELYPSSQADEIPIPIRKPRTFEEILAAELAGQSDPENAVPASVADELPIPIKAPRTFEEILEEQLASQSDPEHAVPSFAASPRKLDESFANIISADTSPLESECEPDLILDSVPAELESEADSGLDSLIKRCKLQEKVLEEGDFKGVAEEASQISSSYLNESERTCSTASEDPECDSPDPGNRTVIDLQADTSATKFEVHSPQVSKAQVSGPQPPSDFEESENIDEEEFTSGDAFKDPGAFDFLSLHGCTRSARDLRKESLYVKFDPLVGAFSSDTRDSSFIMHPENSTETQPGAVGGEDPSQQAFNTSVKLVSLSPSAVKKEAEETAQDAGLITPLKATSHKSTPVKTPAHIMLNETLESIGSRGTLVKQEDLIKKLQEHQSVLEEQDKAYQERISELEQRLQEMDIRRADDIKAKDKELQEKVQSLGELSVIMKEYEKTISRLVAEKSQEKAALEEKQIDLVKDRDQAQQHLNNMEIAFSDIHTKYERLKSVVTAMKKNEETLNAALAEKQENFDKMQNMYDMLKSHAVSKLEKANQDLEAIKQKHHQENAKLKAMVKKLELKTKSVEEALEQKVKENQALTAICDELINKVGE
ncbi:transforming acidic coiled-coil-containing protein 3 isoform X2 [Frankliniella occidentalis]|uniref:Transforming acidic coiled-coil-containing protein 3 isoform X2 n=1 Tax=Frankliniella occidentalis TaxID=133901 RepID=A0A6J1T6E9_FRAOC|nr:transforming acidic coiled-coil-containing protein 3 isoform X2 [Frankliniella occidentalis]